MKPPLFGVAPAPLPTARQPVDWLQSTERRYPVADVALEVLDVRVSPALDLLGGQFTEPTLHHVQPRSRRRREVEMEPAMAQQPALDVGSLVGGVVVEDEMHGQVLGNLLVDAHEELFELRGPV